MNGELGGVIVLITPTGVEIQLNYRYNESIGTGMCYRLLNLSPNSKCLLYC